MPAREDGGTALEEGLKEIARRFSPVLELRVVPPTKALAARYGSSDEDRLLLLRPDGYVGFRCRSHQVAALERRLQEWFVT